MTQTQGLLLDSHVLLWLEAESQLRPQTQLAIAAARTSANLYMSDISLWELGVASHKRVFERRPDLQGLTLEAWFSKKASFYGIRSLRITRRIAMEAANVPSIYGSGDPGDCFLIATARVHKLSLITHDTRILALAKREPEYLSVTIC